MVSFNIMFSDLSILIINLIAFDLSTTNKTIQSQRSMVTRKRCKRNSLLETGSFVRNLK